MEIDDEFELGHLYLSERKCRTCNKMKDLMNDFYRTHKDRGDSPSAYSYECKDCTIKRVTESRKTKKNKPDIPYCPVPPDW